MVGGEVGLEAEGTGERLSEAKLALQGLGPDWAGRVPWAAGASRLHRKQYDHEEALSPSMS